MDYRVDEKGKVYTTRVTKQRARVRALVHGTYVSGTIHLMPGNRVKDELNGDERFIAITDAQVHDAATEQLLHEGGTILLNKDQVAWLIPGDSYDLDVDGNSGAGA